MRHMRHLSRFARLLSTGPEGHADFGRVVKNVADITSVINGQLAQAPVVLYMKGTPAAPQCGFSWKAVQALEAVKARYETHDVLADMRIREGIKKYSQWPTIPQVYISGEFIGGSDILVEMARNGELRKAVEDAGALREE